VVNRHQYRIKRCDRIIRGKKPKVILALGHSEGAVFAVRLALQNTEISHVAALAAAPTSQLLSFYDMAFASEGFIASGGGGKAEQARRVTQAWRDVTSNPLSAEKMVFGHPHRYWADKFAPFPYEKLEKTNAKFFLAYGDKDTNSAPRTMDAFAVELLTRNLDLTWIRVEDGDHGFAKAGSATNAAMTSMLDRVVAWFFSQPFDQNDVVWPITGNPSNFLNRVNAANPT
jgi:pimeloyl-ACP methyl ester carboxylesterase